MCLNPSQQRLIASLLCPIIRNKQPKSMPRIILLQLHTLFTVFVSTELEGIWGHPLHSISPSSASSRYCRWENWGPRGGIVINQRSWLDSLLLRELEFLHLISSPVGVAPALMYSLSSVLTRFWASLTIHSCFPLVLFFCLSVLLLDVFLFSHVSDCFTCCTSVSHTHAWCLLSLSLLLWFQPSSFRFSFF